MTRTLLAAALVSIMSSCGPVSAQDPEWVRDWEAAQSARPRSIPSNARIASATEPGTPLVVTGRVVQADGRTPAPGIVVFAYQTDATGVYNVRGTRGWRLRGWARTDAQGRFTFETIRPAAYPASRIPAHIHLTIEGPSLPRRWAPELQFADDPFLGEEEKKRSAAQGAFGSVRPVSRRGQTQHVDFTIRIGNDGRF